MIKQSHYDPGYFEWQKSIGQLGGLANLFKFRDHVKPDDNVLEFGCGGGYLLAGLMCRARAGIEINPAAIREAERQGITCYQDCDQIPDGWADAIISNSTLEHTSCPLRELERLYRKLKPGGKIVFSVPYESADWSYRPGDINQHLYTWSPMSLGNLFATAGFVVISADVNRLMWPPFSARLMKLLGESGFHLVCRLYWLIRVILRPIKPIKVAASIRVVATR